MNEITVERQVLSHLVISAKGMLSWHYGIETTLPNARMIAIGFRVPLSSEDRPRAFVKTSEVISPQITLRLQEQEREILIALLGGRSDEEISRTIGISLEGINQVKSAILAKLSKQ